MDTPDTRLDRQLEDIARKHLSIDTLATRSSDRHDFLAVAVRSVQQALKEAVQLGRLLQEEESKPDWRRLAMQFDGHRMQALGHLRCMVEDPQRHKEQAETFLSAGPLSGEQVLAERIQAIAALRLGPPQFAAS
jgi:hypothetical protein